MKQWIKYILVGLIFFIIGGLFVFLIERHTNLMKQGAKSDLVQSAQAAAKEKVGKKATASKTSKDAKKSSAEAASKKKGADTKVSPKKDAAKKKDEESATEDGSVEYLRSLWPIKKRKAATVSGKKQGALYFSGTSPYGPPPSYKDHIMNPTKSLKIKGDPQPEKSLPPLKSFPKAAPSLNKTTSRPQARLYQIEIGKFSSLDKALTAKKMVENQGYKVRIYYQGHISNPDWFFVRIETLFYEHQAYKEAQQVSRSLRITPSVIASNNTLPHLK